MSRSLKSYWANQVTLTEIDRKRLAFFIGEELRYYNNLVSAFAGPMRSMPETFAKTASLDDLLAVIAERMEAPNRLRVDRLHPAYHPHQHLLFDGPRLALDDRTVFIADTLAYQATLAPEVRRAMAMTVLKEFRRQSKALNESASTEAGAMPSIVEALAPIEREQKRHVQLPRSSVKVSNSDKDELTIKLPYMSETFVVPKPNASWNYVYMRSNPDGTINLDLAFEEAPYVLRKVDRVAGRGKTKGEPHLARQGLREER